MFSFDHSDEHQEVSIGSVEKETKANKKKASKRDIVVDGKELLARNSKLSRCFVCQYAKWKACGCVRGEYYCNIHLGDYEL